MTFEKLEPENETRIFMQNNEFHWPFGIAPCLLFAFKTVITSAFFLKKIFKNYVIVVVSRVVHIVKYSHNCAFYGENKSKF